LRVRDAFLAVLAPSREIVLLSDLPAVGYATFFLIRYHGAVKQFDAEILENRAVADSWRELVLSWDVAGRPLPGQFLTLKVSPFSDPLLRRPFAFSSYKPSSPEGRARASVIYQIRGGATRLLSELAPGSLVNAIGPLGRGFPEPATGEAPILAGGGIGLGPLLFLAEALASAGREARLILGVRGASLLPSIALPAGTVLCTDDGSSGFKGTPVDYLEREAAEGSLPPSPRVYGCGPLPMLAALAELCASRRWAGSFSAEQWMACGVGACMGCALPRADGKGYLRACADGPVFDSSEIAWGAT
jgi:dihydroorotate dehydrogenase electron transfer subunit